MRTKLLLLITLAALIFTSCTKEDETDTVWAENSIEAFNRIAASAEYKTIY